MPSLSNQVPRQMASTASATRPRSLDPPQGKSLDKASVRNTFLWTNWPNGDTGHLDAHHSDRQFLTNLKDGSVYSLTAPRSSVSSYTREASLSKDSSSHSLGNGSQRDMKDSGRGSVTLDRDLARKSSDTGHDVASVTASIASQPVNGTMPPAPRKTLVNGDQNTFVDRLALSDTDVPRSSTTRLSSSQPEPRSFLSPDVDGFPSNKASTVHRYSSPPAPPSGMDGGQFQDPTASTTSNLRNRNTLHPRRGSVGRRNSRDQSDDTAYSTARRTSQSLMRRSTRTNNSDSHPDDANPDDDAARWAKAVKQQRQYKRKRRDEDDDDRVIVGTKVDQNHVNWVTAYNMLTGIRFTVSRINAKMDRELTPADFQAKHKFSFDITGNELTPSAKYDFKFKDYAPWVFRHLRAKFRLDPADYLMSLTSKYILSELGSPGKSGSFFYFSRDYKYIIKTIHHSEHKLLRKILPEYYKHVEENPNTLISQFYGLHRVKMAYGRKIHFVVMNNLFPPHRDIHQTFDLKGSTIGRDLSEDDLKKNPRGTMKDLNWIRRHRHIECGPQKREVFITQLKRDVELLKRLKIMDYSLLVGIHDLERGNDEKLRNKTLQVFQPVGDRDEDSNPNVLMRTPSRLENERKARELRMLIQRERPVPLDQAAAKMPDEILDERKSHIFYSDDGGFRATDENGQYRDEIYYLGIIDFLTHVREPCCYCLYSPCSLPGSCSFYLFLLGCRAVPM
ncbi:hypothetical protein MAP00_008213 [Monascus purpureus]|nr:hypothetical protein MAP00_008213 [Monascus purpureus]